jgi:hypothetical protein
MSDAFADRVDHDSAPALRRSGAQAEPSPESR